MNTPDFEAGYEFGGIPPEFIDNDIRRNRNEYHAQGAEGMSQSARPLRWDMGQRTAAASEALGSPPRA